MQQPACPQRILIVEDSFLAAQALGDVVRDLGYEIAGTTPSVAGGLRVLEQEAIDAAIVDINLGGRPSFPVCTALQARKIPFLFVSGYSPGTFVPTELRSAPHLGKPVDPRQLRRALLDIISPAPAVPDITTPAPARFGNIVLDSLPSSERAVMQGALEEVVLKKGDIVESYGQPVSHLYFPIDALLSIVAGVDRGTRIEVACVGRDSMTAPAVLLGDRMALGEVVVQAGGRAWRLPASAAHGLAEGNPVLRRHLMSHVAQSLRQLVDTSMFNGRATIVERLARWLAYAASRLDATRLDFTHDAIARTLGVRRPSVTVGLQILEGDRLIRSTRRAIVLLDPAGLARRAGIKNP